MKLLPHIPYLTYAYLKLGSRVRIGNCVVKTIPCSSEKNKWFMNLNV